MAALRQEMFVVLALVFVISLAVSGDSKPESKRGWLGVSISDVSSRVAKDQNLKSRDGAYVTDVEEESPADEAGIQEGDVIVEFAGRALFDADDLAKAVRRTEPGTKVPVVVYRKGEKKTLTVKIGEAPRHSRARAFSFRVAPPRIAIFTTSEMMGMKLMDLNPQLATYFGIKGDEGVLVTEVQKESAAAKAGVTAGDVILTIGKRQIDDVDDVRRALDRYDEGDKVEIGVSRRGEKKTLTATAEAVGEEFEIPAMPHMRLYRNWEWERGDADLDVNLEVPNIDLAPLHEKLLRLNERILDRNQKALKKLEKRLDAVVETEREL